MKKITAGAICGKFRIVHMAHKELVLKASSIVDELNIFIVDDNCKRYISIDDTISVFKEIAQSVDLSYKIHVINAKSDQYDWDKMLEKYCGTKDMVVFNSKEDYDNKFINNQFLSLDTPVSLSATDLEKNMYARCNSLFISPEFLNKVKINIELIGPDNFIKKVAAYYNCNYIINDKLINGVDKRLHINTCNEFNLAYKYDDNESINSNLTRVYNTLKDTYGLD